MGLFSQVFTATNALGRAAGVALPEGRDPVPAEVLGRLLPHERAHALTLTGRRQIEWVGGRLAFRLAVRDLGVECGPLMTGQRGEPLLPAGLAGSVSHKRSFAIALVGEAGAGTLGVDLEERQPSRIAIASRVLRPEEKAVVDALPEEQRWEAVLVRFAVKEAIYKAIHPHVSRYVRFDEASVSLEGMNPTVTLHLEGKSGVVEGPFHVEAAAEWREGLLLASARLNPR